MRRRRGTLLLVSLSSACLLTNCGGGLGCRSKEPVRFEQALPAGTAKVRVELPTGILEVLVGEGPGLRFEGTCKRAADTEGQLQQLLAAPSQPSLKADPSAPGTAALVFPGPPAADGLRTCLVAYEGRLWLPADVAIDCRIEQAGQLTVEHRLADVLAHLGHGDLRVTDCQGRCEIFTGAGATLVHNHRGDVRAEANAGEMQIWMSATGKELRLKTGQGNVQCHIPADTSFRLDASTAEGKATAKAFGIDSVRGANYGATLQGQRGDGATSIVMRVGSGHVSLSPRQ